ncbi:MAG: chromosome segregation protein SMC [Bacteroides sp.]|nr:chromosome segregation protein SMC [Bacteroides sp.]MCM1550897.1 chromosome segregation protein SMC [Clostridium sp.]
MYLKSIEVYGFKSFANKILFQFENGITGIVGPNGSGKSNVADAVRWVLGEQSAKQLRGAKMEDVIFAGTEMRKPHGSAYVAITLDNSDHVLPIDYEEVTVARRVYRSGESEYLINGAPCRLKDIHNMFFDTGIGKEGYSIIGQGQVEKILSGKPEERRELFDEAAGIVKYKKNKAATEKALESERQNLFRVNDILSELEKQVGPLEKQSETAKKYLLFKEEMKQLDVNVFLLDSDRIRSVMEENQKNLQIVTGRTDELNHQYETIKTEYERLETELEQCNQKIDTGKTQTTELKLAVERAEGEVRVLNQKIDSVRVSDAQISEQIRRVQDSLLKQTEEQRAYQAKKAVLDEKLDTADDVVEEARAKSQEIQDEISRLEENIEKNKADIIELMNENSSIKGKVARYDALLENINFRKTQINQRYVQFKSDEMADREQYEALQKQLQELDAQITLRQDALAVCDKKLDGNTEATHENRDALARLRNEYSAAKAKAESLRNITERYDGYGNSIRRVMEQKKHTKGIIGVVADIISVPQKYEIAIETALGGSIQNIVTAEEGTAKRLIQYLKQNKYGRATFLPLTSIAGGGSFTKQEALQEPGTVGLASTLVQIQPEYQAVAEHLLGRILVVDHIDHALSIAKKYHYSIRIVTLEGELLTPGGAMTGGAYKNSSNLLGRKRELDELNQVVEDHGRQIYEAEKQEQELRTIRDTLKEEKETLSARLQELYLEKNTNHMNLEQVNSRLSEHATIFASLQNEGKELDAQIEEINHNKNQLFEGNKFQEQAKLDCEARIAKYEEDILEQKSLLETANAKVSELLLEFNTIKQQDDFYIENIHRIRVENDKLKAELEEYNRRTHGAAEEIMEINEQINGIQKEMNQRKTQIQSMEEQLQADITKKEEMMASHKEFFQQRETLREEISNLDKEAYRLNAQAEKISEQSDSLNNYMWEEYELTYNRALELRKPEYTDLAMLRKELSAVKNKIKSLGDVNVNAIEDYKNVSERYEFLKNQHDDIVKAEENLKRIIAELDTAMRAQFSEKFAEIQIMFDKVFKELFGGGKASLVLVEEEDILEAGIKIIAQPPGKKLQNMMQLSGGEKSLTAIALLFAIQSLKPSPFCLLDEIEAALDDSNVTRFAKYLHKLTKDTQFIVITHRKGTMEAADILYGITMQEKGVSTLVSVNLIENELDK